MATAIAVAPAADEWAGEFIAWLRARCVASPRFSTNVDALYRDFCEWCELNNDWPCDRDQFLALVQQSQTRLHSIGDVILASGIGLAVDVEAARQMYRVGTA
jgi:hypothetical protein